MSALLALETTPGQWVRKDKLAMAEAKTGVQGHPQLATEELAKIYNDMKVDLAVNAKLISAAKAPRSC